MGDTLWLFEHRSLWLHKWCYQSKQQLSIAWLYSPWFVKGAGIEPVWCHMNMYKVIDRNYVTESPWDYAEHVGSGWAPVQQWRPSEKITSTTFLVKKQFHDPLTMRPASAKAKGWGRENKKTTKHTRLGGLSGTTRRASRGCLCAFVGPLLCGRETERRTPDNTGTIPGQSCSFVLMLGSFDLLRVASKHGCKNNCRALQLCSTCCSQLRELENFCNPSLLQSRVEDQFLIRVPAVLPAKVHPMTYDAQWWWSDPLLIYLSIYLSIYLPPIQPSRAENYWEFFSEGLHAIVVIEYTRSL